MKKVIILAALAALTCSACDDPNNSITRKTTSGFNTIQHSQVNGTKDTSAAHKAVVALRLSKYSYYQDQTICTGTLVTDKYVITAAHCISELGSFSYKNYTSSCIWEGISKVSGLSDYSNNIKIAIGTTESEVSKRTNQYAVKSITYHPNYSDYYKSSGCTNDTDTGYKLYSGTLGDIAIIELKTAVPEDVAKPIPVLPPWLGITNKQAQAGLATEFVGFGFDEKGNSGTKLTFTGPLKYYCGSTVSQDNCYPNFSVHIEGCHPNAEMCKEYGHYDEDDNYIMVPWGSMFYLQSEGGPCHGDSGGPAFVTVGGVEYLAGITSYGDPTCYGYGVSTAVQDYYDWIVSKAPAVANSFSEICNNGVDDDGNGYTDKKDPACNVNYCGDNVINQSSEQCDGSAFVNNVTSCAALDASYQSGSISCNKDCTVNYSNCVKKPVCGNGIIESGEQCDGAAFPRKGSSCKDYSFIFSSGTLSCSDTCTILTTNCVSANLNPPEGDPDNGNNNGSNGDPDNGNNNSNGDPDNGNNNGSNGDPENGNNNGANVAPDNGNNNNGGIHLPDDESGSCGNNILDNDEMCDGALFRNSNQCSDWLLTSAKGTVTCNANCTVNTSSCVVSPVSKCGNGIVEGDEECDVIAFAADRYTCADWNSRYISGNAKCNANCTVNFSDCVAADGSSPDSAIVTDTRPSGSDSCSSTTRSGATTPSIFAFLGLFGLIALRRRKLD